MCRANWGRIGLAILAGVWLVGGIGCSTRPAAEKGGGQSRVDDNELAIGEPLSHGNLTIFLVSSKVAKKQDRFITLDEGLKNGKVVVAELGSVDENPEEHSDQNSDGNGDVEDPFGETGGGADVNRLLVTNNSDRPLYLMPGEIFVGGQQDRTLAQEVIVPPHTHRMPIDVFCVEHGRWSHRGSQQVAAFAALTADLNPSDTVNINALTARASAGQFPQSGAALGKIVRLAVQSGRDQAAVWDQVDRVNKETWATTDSQDFTANYVDREIVEKLEPYVKAFDKQVAEANRVVGVIVAINGRVEATDVFESTPLFRKLWPKLLRSYALDAVTAQDGDEHQPGTLVEATAFFDRVRQAKVEEQETEEGLVTASADTDEIASFSLHDREGSGQLGHGAILGGHAAGVGGMRGAWVEWAAATSAAAFIPRASASDKPIVVH